MLLSPPISHQASTYPFSPLPLRKEIQPFLLCLSLCVVFGVVFPPLDQTFSHPADETFAHRTDGAFSHQMAETVSHQ